MTTFQSISLSVANDGLGDPLRDGGLRINSNFMLAAEQIDATSKNINDNVGSLTNLLNVQSSNFWAEMTSLNADVNTLYARTDTLSAWVNSVAGPRVFNTQTTDYTLALTDQFKIIDMRCDSPSEIVIPLNSGVAFPNGTQIDWVQSSTGQITFVCSGTMFSSSGFTKSSRRGAMGTLLCMSADNWVLGGDIGA